MQEHKKKTRFKDVINYISPWAATRIDAKKPADFVLFLTSWEIGFMAFN